MKAEKKSATSLCYRILLVAWLVCNALLVDCGAFAAVVTVFAIYPQLHTRYASLILAPVFLGLPLLVVLMHFHRGYKVPAWDLARRRHKCTARPEGPWKSPSQGLE